MKEELKLSPDEGGQGETPWFLKLAFLFFLLWAVYYLWKNVQMG